MAIDKPKKPETKIVRKRTLRESLEQQLKSFRKGFAIRIERLLSDPGKEIEKKIVAHAEEWHITPDCIKPYFSKWENGFSSWESPGYWRFEVTKPLNFTRQDNKCYLHANHDFPHPVKVEDTNVVGDEYIEMDKLEINGARDYCYLPRESYISRLSISNSCIDQFPDTLKVGEELHLAHCPEIQGIPDNLKLRYLGLFNCPQLKKIPDNTEAREFSTQMLTGLEAIPQHIKTQRFSCDLDFVLLSDPREWEAMGLNQTSISSHMAALLAKQYGWTSFEGPLNIHISLGRINLSNQKISIDDFNLNILRLIRGVKDLPRLQNSENNFTEDDIANAKKFIRQLIRYLQVNFGDAIKSANSAELKKMQQKAKYFREQLPLILNPHILDHIKQDTANDTDINLLLAS